MQGEDRGELWENDVDCARVRVETVQQCNGVQQRNGVQRGRIEPSELRRSRGKGRREVSIGVGGAGATRLELQNELVALKRVN